MKKLNFTVDRNVHFSEASEPPLTTTDLVKKIRKSLTSMSSEAEAFQPEPGAKRSVAPWLFSQQALAKPSFAGSAITVAKQYRYRGVRISLLKSESGRWKAAWSLFVNENKNCIKSDQLVSEGPAYDAEALAASHAMCAIDLALTSGG